MLADSPPPKMLGDRPPCCAVEPLVGAPTGHREVPIPKSSSSTSPSRTPHPSKATPPIFSRSGKNAWRSSSILPVTSPLG